MGILVVPDCWLVGSAAPHGLHEQELQDRCCTFAADVVGVGVAVVAVEVEHNHDYDNHSAVVAAVLLHDDGHKLLHERRLPQRSERLPDCNSHKPSVSDEDGRCLSCHHTKDSSPYPCSGDKVPGDNDDRSDVLVHLDSTLPL